MGTPPQLCSFDVCPDRLLKAWSLAGEPKCIPYVHLCHPKDGGGAGASWASTGQRSQSVSHKSAVVHTSKYSNILVKNQEEQDRTDFNCVSC